MQQVAEYTFKRRILAPESMDNLPFVQKISPLVEVDFKPHVHHDLVLITGDGWCLFDDLAAFNALEIPHDLFCVNRSIRAMTRPANHWAAIDTEESVWLSQYLTPELVGINGLLKHTIGWCPGGFNCWWRVDDKPEDIEFLLWAGSTSYFAILAALYMGYRRVVLAGVPMDCKHHWYEPEGTNGPSWKGQVFHTWMDFARTKPARNVRSMSGYTAFMLGKPDKEWMDGR
ncbi:MAG: hypothetical protein WC455_20735 [Dehalococcoidia bacterium]|jgi:hypothetical protein